MEECRERNKISFARTAKGGRLLSRKLVAANFASKLFRCAKQQNRSVASPLSKKFCDTFWMPECKVYNDGSHYIAIPYTTKPHKPRTKKKEEVITVKPPAEKISEEVKEQESAPPVDDALLPLEKIAVTGELPKEAEPEQPANILKPNGRRMTKKELFNELYQEYAFLKKQERREKLITALRPYFKNDDAVKVFVDTNLERKTRNLIARRIRLTRKVNLQDFNYFVTVTYFYGQ